MHLWKEGQGEDYLLHCTKVSQQPHGTREKTLMRSRGFHRVSGAVGIGGQHPSSMIISSFQAPAPTASWVAMRRGGKAPPRQCAASSRLSQVTLLLVVRSGRTWSSKRQTLGGSALSNMSQKLPLAMVASKHSKFSLSVTLCSVWLSYWKAQEWNISIRSSLYSVTMGY